VGDAGAPAPRKNPEAPARPAGAKPTRPQPKPRQQNTEDFWDRDDNSLGNELPQLPRRTQAPAKTKQDAKKRVEKSGPGIPGWMIYSLGGFAACLGILAVLWFGFLKPSTPKHPAGEPNGAEWAATNGDPANPADATKPATPPDAVAKTRRGRNSGATRSDKADREANSTVAAAGTAGTDHTSFVTHGSAAVGAGQSVASIAGSARPRAASQNDWNSSPTSGQTPTGSQTPSVAPGAELPLEDLIDRVSESVVLIRVYDKSDKELGFGSGFVIHPSGLVATCLHVVRHAHRVRVQFRDQHLVEVSGAKQLSPQTDLAILQLAGKQEHLVPLPVPDHLTLKPGQEVIAFGHPRGLKFTPTKGMVNNVHKTADLPPEMRLFLSIMNVSKDDEWIQTDAVISEGNSGGPLINRQGQVIGINSWISKDTHFAFAVHVRHLAALEGQLYAKAEPFPEALKKIHADGGTGELLDEKVEQVLNEYQRAHEEYTIELNRLKAGNPTRAEAESFLKKNPAVHYVPKLLQLGNANRKTKIAFQAYVMSCILLKGTDPKATNRFLQQATEALLADHIQEKYLAGVALAMTTIPQHDTKGFLRSLLQKSPHREVQAFACLALATNLQQQSNEKPDSHAAAAADKEIATLLTRITHDFGDVPLGGKPLSELAKPLLYEKEHLRIGIAAPDIVGTDGEGKDFRLKDYRGKVVLLVFWGDWSPYCVQLYPYVRIFVSKLQGRRFAMLGVNTDTPERIEAIQKEKKVTWRSWNDGPIPGPIASQWNISTIPTMYLIDHKGIIRFKGTLEPDFIEQAIDTLLAEAETGKKSTARKRTTRRSYSRP
jgi:S1-C subfamily serine protease/peroxiredoxin